MKPDEPSQPVDDGHFDEAARAAGAALRRQAPNDGLDRLRRARRHQLARRAMTAGTAVVVLAVGAVIATSNDRSSVAPEATSLAPTSTPVPNTSTTSPTTTVSSTVSSPTTVTSGDATSTTQFDPLSFTDVGAWSELSGDSGVENLSNPCCEDTYHDVTSPELPPTGQPLPDGEYNARFEWPTDVSQPLVVTVRRYVPCADLVGGCTQFGIEYGATARFVDSNTSYTLTFPLNDSTRVIYSCGTVWEATGAEFGRLLRDYTAAFNSVVAPRLAAGESLYAIFDDLAAHPHDGFNNWWYAAGGHPPVSLNHYDDNGTGIAGTIVGASLVVTKGVYTLSTMTPIGG